MSDPKPADHTPQAGDKIWAPDMIGRRHNGTILGLNDDGTGFIVSWENGTSTIESTDGRHITWKYDNDTMEN